MRLVSYNLLEGLRPIGSALDERRQLDRERTAAARQVITDLKPDILVLNEALYSRNFRGHVVDYARLFGFPYQTAALYDGAWGNAILSHCWILKSCEMKTEERGGLVAVIVTPFGELTVASYHPHPRRHPADKASDFDRLVTGLAGPLIVCGDLNCISPEDTVDREEMIVAFRRFAHDPRGVIDQFVESGRKVFGALERHGLHDAIPVTGRRYSIPTDLISSDKSSGIRIDHILANEWIETTAGEVVHSPTTNVASDHHPVALDFRLRTPDKSVYQT